MRDDSTMKTVLVALGVCLVCSVLVSTAAIGLSARQEQNKRLDMIKNILVAGGLYDASQNVQSLFSNKVVPLMVELSSGRILSPGEIPQDLDIASFDLKRAASHPEYGMRIPPEQDIANIHRRPKYMVVYQIADPHGGGADKIILPIYGYGLWSTLYGFIALGRDLNIVEGITFYDHGETPGLGGEVDNPRWKALWKGKRVFGEDGEVALSVVKRAVDPNNPLAAYQVDGLSGATITSRGIDHMLKYWLGDQGYGPLLDALRKGEPRG